MLRNRAHAARKSATSSGARSSCSTTSASGARANDRAGSLPYGDQRRLEIARALATEPKLLALDEPAAGMNADRDAWRCASSSRRIRADGITLLLIEHDVRLVMNVCDRVMVLDYGEKIAEGAPARGAARPEGHRGLPRARRMLLEVQADLEVHYGGIRAVKGIDLEVGEGELVCLIGANGAGKTIDAEGDLRADRPRSAARSRYAGEDIARAPVHELPRSGLVMVPEGRGIFAQLTVRGEPRDGRLRARRRRLRSAQYARFPAPAERRAQIAGTLSGGEQQMLAIARALMSRAEAAAARRAVDGPRAADGGEDLRDRARHRARRA